MWQTYLITDLTLERLKQLSKFERSVIIVILRKFDYLGRNLIIEYSATF